MLNTHKLLYILPDVAYVAELLPGKKPHSFLVQAFRQINGEYLNDNEFIADNVSKLLAKVEEGEYTLILPDFLFTNTMVTVKETEQKKIDSFVTDNLLPQLSISADTHQFQIHTLTSLKGESRVQFSALEQSLLQPLLDGSKKSGATIVGIAPLSWSIKSVVSLEPSVTILQMGTNLFSALHYIGVDQTFQAPTDDVEAMAETIKTLKGSEPNIQTVYLVTNAVVEEKLKELLSDTIPLQQLNPQKEDESKMPSYVKYCVESAQKTLSISDYPVPLFALGKSADAKKSKPTNVASDTDDDPESSANSEPKALESPEEVEALPQPSAPQLASVVTQPEPIVIETKETPAMTEDTNKTEPVAETETKDEVETVAKPTDEITVTPAETATDGSSATDSDTSTQAAGDVDLSQFVVQTGDDASAVTSDTTKTTKPEVTKAAATKPIKNQSGVSSMIKMIAITLVVFIATVAVGVGIGFGLLTLSKSKTPATPTPTAVEEVTPTATPEPTPVASESAQLDPADLSILVVNATSKAGYAGTTKSKLETAGYGTVDAGNAKGEYATAENNLVLMSEENAAFVMQLEKVTDLGLAFSEGYGTEDTSGKYDAVIVLTK